jgi:Icc-related predicted phosphoesterase
MRIVAISDTHNKHAQLRLPPGDVFIQAGDMTTTGTTKELAAYANWLGTQDYKHKLVLSGNHDLAFRNQTHDLAVNLLREAGATYLQDNWVEIDDVLFYGTPWTALYAAMAFELPRNSTALAEKWALIPDATNVLITHQPPHLILDYITGNGNQGCPFLAERLTKLDKLRAHLFGHYHFCGSTIQEVGNVKFANCAVLNDAYQLHNRPIVLIDL